MKIYEDHILDHAEFPYHKGVLEHYTHEAEETSPLCGDRIRFMFDVNPETQQITNIGWDGEGCVLCLAAASILAEHVHQKGLSIRKVVNSETMEALLMIEVPRSREGCILLPLKVLQKIQPKENP